MNVNVQIISAEEQRYPTCGDWWVDKPTTVWEGSDWNGDYVSVPQTLQIRVTKMVDPRFEQLVYHHELTEALLCLQAGINPDDVDAFDKAFEDMRDRMKKKLSIRETDFMGNIMGIRSWQALNADIEAEPGDCIAAPYYKQHQIATGFERVMAAEMGVDWNTYDKACQEA